MAKYTLPPRQKMINLLYVVLIAMLAINISSDVLEGYGQMNNDYLPQIKKLEEYNRTLLERINSRNDKACHLRFFFNVNAFCTAAVSGIANRVPFNRCDVGWAAD